MKLYTVLVLSAIVFFQSCSGPSSLVESENQNAIDSIQNAEQITDLLTKIDANYEGFQVSNQLNFKDTLYQRLADSLDVRPWYKADFDQNGQTDLMVIGSSAHRPVLCIFDEDGKYRIQPLLPQKTQKFLFTTVEGNKVQYYFENTTMIGEELKPREIDHTTLVYKFGGFIQMNENPSKKNIETITFSTTGCYGSCPVYNLEIQKDRSAKFEAIKFNTIDNRKMLGIYTSTIAQKDYNQIIGLLNYMDFENLEDNYSVNWTDDQTVNLKIVYNDGKIKFISDYGARGTNELVKLYHLLNGIRENQKWEYKSGGNEK